MQSEEFTVRNVKCGGCVQNIVQGLREEPGVREVEAQVEGGRVRVRGEGLDRARLAERLRALGYPEA